MKRKSFFKALAALCFAPKALLAIAKKDQNPTAASLTITNPGAGYVIDYGVTYFPNGYIAVCKWEYLPPANHS